MTAFNFNPTQHNPNFGGGGDTLGVGKHPVVGSKVELKNAQGGSGNGYLALTVTAIDGPGKGGTKTIRYNLHNSSEQAQRIAHEQLAATCLVMGITGPWSDTDILLNKPFVIDNVLQRGDNPNNYTEVVGVYTMDGRSAQEAASNPPQAAGNAPANFNAGGAATGSQGAGSPAAGSGGGWGGNAGGGAPMEQNAQGGWSQAGGGGASPAGGASGGGWQQNAGGAATTGGWGQQA